MRSASVAVTVIVDVSPSFACVVSMISVPLGLVDDSVAELIVSGLAARLVCRREPLYVSGILVIWLTVLTPVSNWPKSV